MSRYSPAVVYSGEQLTRLVSSTNVHRKTKKPLPSLFSHAAKQGCSIQRESIASAEEVRGVARTILEANAEAVWLGVVSATCASVRALRLDKPEMKVACVYDTAEGENPAHAEICWTDFALDEGDAGQLRKMLLDVFDADNVVSAKDYRGGDVWRDLPVELRDRTMA